MMVEKKKHPLASIKEAFAHSKSSSSQEFSPIPEEKIVHEIKASNAFEKMGVLILAGGQGTRLGFDGPKGCFELPLKKKKSLFQIHLEKVKKKGKNLSIAIMTSPLNHEATKDFLKANSWFGLNPEQIDLFQQELIPMCDDQGYLFFEAPDRLAEAPAGNGKALFHLYHSPIWDKWQTKNIEYIQVVPVDNPLAEPFDGELLACHETVQSDIVLKCIRRIDPEEKLGVIVAKGNQLMIREYSEVSQEVKTGCIGDQLAYFLGHSGLFSCSIDFIKRMADASFVMPWHLAHKKGKQMILTPDGFKIESIWVWKFETFIFDLFPHAQSFQVIVGDRKKCFAPLKNLTGSDNPKMVAEAVESQLHFN